MKRKAAPRASAFLEYDALAYENRVAGEARPAANHVAKRFQKTKGAEVVFDPQGHKEYLTGFHKRKVQRRNKALKQQKEKERQERTTFRAEKRAKMKLDLGLPDDYGVGSSDEDDAAKDKAALKPSAVRVYKAQGVTTTVTTIPLDSDQEVADPGEDEEEEEEEEEEEHSDGEEGAAEPSSSRGEEQGAHAAVSRFPWQGSNRGGRASTSQGAQPRAGSSGGQGAGARGGPLASVGGVGKKAGKKAHKLKKQAMAEVRKQYHAKPVAVEESDDEEEGGEGGHEPHHGRSAAHHPHRQRRGSGGPGVKHHKKRGHT